MYSANTGGYTPKVWNENTQHNVPSQFACISLHILYEDGCGQRKYPQLQRGKSIMGLNWDSFLLRFIQTKLIWQHFAFVTFFGVFWNYDLWNVLSMFCCLFFLTVCSTYSKSIQHNARKRHSTIAAHSVPANHVIGNHLFEKKGTTKVVFLLENTPWLACLSDY